jgi:hypothetical protein
MTQNNNNNNKKKIIYTQDRKTDRKDILRKTKTKKPKKKNE